MLQKSCISDKCCSSELSIHQRNLKNYTLLFSTTIIIIKFFLAANQNIRFLKDRDTLMMLKKSALKSGINSILKCIKIESSYFK